MLLSRARRFYLALACAGLLTTGLSAARIGPDVPYGSYAPWILVGLTVAAFFVGLRFLREHQAAKDLLTGDLLAMSPAKIPTSPMKTYLGAGFVWTTRHAEELYRQVASGIEPQEDVVEKHGGNPMIHGLGRLEERPIMLPDEKLPHHMLVLGSSGGGKTRFLELLARQLVAKGDVLIVIDPKGDTRLMDAIVEEADTAGRGGDVLLFAPPWPSASVAYNPLTNFAHPSEIADRIIGIFPPGGGDSEAFRGYQWGATAAVAQAIYVAGLPMTFTEILRFLRKPQDLFFRLVDARFPKLKEGGLQYAEERYRKLLDSGEMKHRPELDDILHYCNEDPVYYGKMTGSLLPQVERLVSGIRADLVAPDPLSSTRPILDWKSVVSRRQIVYVYPGSLASPASSKALGKMILLDFQAFVAGRYAAGVTARSTDPLISLMVDEAADQITPEFTNVMAQARGAKISAILSLQDTSQIELAMGSKAAIDEVSTNSYALIQFPTRSTSATKGFSELIGKRRIRIIGEAHRYEAGFLGSGLKNIDDFRATYQQSATHQDAELMPSWALAQLPTFHYVARIGARLIKARCPLLDEPQSGFTASLIRKGAVA